MRRLLLSVLAGLTLACGGLPAPVETDLVMVPGPTGPRLGWVHEVGDQCALVTQIPGQDEQVLASWHGGCGGSWTLAHHPSDPERHLVLTLGEGIVLVEVVGGTPTVLPAPSQGTLEAAAYDEDGHVVAWTEAEAQGEDTDMFGTVTCRYWRWDGAWAQLSKEDKGLFEGMSPPWCDGLEGQPMKMDKPGNYASVGFSDAPVPADRPAPPDPEGEELGAWTYLPDFDLLVRGYWFEGQFLIGPVMRWDGAAWAALPGLDVPGESIELREQGEHLLICMSGHKARLFDAARNPVWTGERCPAFWP